MSRLSVRHLLAMVAIFGAPAVSVDGAGASALSEGPRLAFTAMTELSREAFSVREVTPDGSQLATLVRGSRRGLAPRPFSKTSWSADGSLLAFAGFSENRSGIYTVRADGTGLRLLRGTKEGNNPVFSPDGGKVAFTRLQLGKNLSLGRTLWVANADGRSAYRLTALRDGVDYLPSSFSPDGSRLAATKIVLGSKDKPDALLFRLDGSGGARVLARRASEPVFSPDGSKIALVRHSIVKHQRVPIAHRDLQVVRVDDMTIQPLTRTHRIGESYPSWDPSGERIAFISSRISEDPIAALFDGLLPFGNSIAQINADGSCRQKILSLKGTALVGPVWQPGPGREAGRIEC